ncbi:MAG TPA: tandem-95 repeat protein [Planctomycetes bacterium]|nr:tandem-95 repeat protein [Planctomycetota bacterium]
MPTDIAVTEDVSSNVDLSTIDLADIDAGGASLIVTLTTSTGGDITAAAGTGITIGGTSTGRTLTGSLTDLNNYLNTASNLTYLHGTPLTNGDNADTIQVNVNDNGNTGTGGGTNIDLGTVNVDIGAVNDDPVNTVPGTQTIAEETTTAISGISITDVDAAAASLTTRLQVSNGVVNVTLSGGATISAGSNGTADMTIQGSVTDINATLASLTYTGNTDVVGTAADTLTVTTNDLGNTGSGGAKQDVDNIQIDITAVNDAPVITSSATASLAENQTAVLTVTTTDVDSPADTVTYSITGGADQGSFSINGSTGVLTFSTAPDFETPTDVGTDNVYDVQVTANDGAGGTDVQSISVTVTDVNDTAPVVTASQSFNVSEDAANTTSVGTVLATDADTIGSLQNWTITAGNGDGVFAINAGTGEITVTDNTNLDRETTASYVLTLTVGDGINALATETVTINVTDVNEDPVITSSVTASVTENQTGVLTVTSTDEDLPADTVTYSITGGADQAKFSINSASGVLSFSTAPDFENPTDVGTDNVYDVQVTANDGAGGTDVQLISVTVTDVNDAPTITPIADQTPLEDTATGAIAFTVGDDETGTGSLTVTATSSDQTLVPDGNITLGGSGANRTINVLPAANRTGGPATITVTVNDGTTTTQTTFDVTVTAVNDAPTILLPGSVVNFAEGDAATVIDSLSVVSDIDSSNYDTGTLTADFMVSGTANDRLTINNQGTGSGQIGVSGLNVTYEGVTIGTFVGGTDGFTPLVVTFNASSTPSAVEALVRNITYENVAEDPSTVSRTVRFVLTDGDGGTSNTETETINVAAVNDLSVVTMDASTLTYTGGSAIDIDSTLTVTDVDDSVLVSAEVRLANGYVQGEDVLVFVDQSGITGAFNATTGILTLTGSATVADYETALRSVQYNNVNSSPTFGILTSTFTVNDGTGVSNVATRQIEVIDEDPPRVPNDSATVVEGGAVVIDLAANDSDNFDALDLTSISIVSGPTNGSVLVNGDGTVTYTHDGSETTADTFTYTIEDSSDLLSNVATVSLTITPVNDAPTITTIVDQTLLEDTVTGAIAFTIGDAETAAGTLTVTATSNDQTLVPDGNITLGGSGASRTINVLPSVNQSGGPATITVTVDDGNDDDDCLGNDR